MRLSRRTSHPLFVEEETYNWAKGRGSVIKLLSVSLLGLAMVGVVLLIAT